MYEDAHLEGTYEARYEEGLFFDGDDREDYDPDDEDALLMECGHSVDCECDCAPVDEDGDEDAAVRDRAWYALS